MRKVLTKRMQLWKQFNPLLKSDRKYYGLLGGIKVFHLVLSLVDPFIYLILINEVMIGGRLNLLPLVIAGYIASYLLQTLGVVANKRFSHKIFFKLTLKLKAALMKKMSVMTVSAYEKYGIGDLKNRVDEDTKLIEKFFQTHIMDYFYEIASAVIIAVILVWMNWILAITSFVMVPFSFWFVKLMEKKAKAVSEKQRKLQGEYDNYIYGSLQNWRQIKANNLEEDRAEGLDRYHKKLSGVFVKNQIYWYINRAFTSFKDFFITRMNLYFIGGILIINGYADVGILLVFMNYYTRFFGNISKITDTILSLKNDEPGLERVLEILEEAEDKKEHKIFTGNGIEISHVSFGYGNAGQPVLDDLTLTVKSGEHIAIVGRSGCGKTTLAKLLMGLHAPDSGEIHVGGVAVSRQDVKNLGKKMGIVQQNPSLFNLSIRENLLLAVRGADDRKLEEACKKANIYEFIESLEKGFDTIIGEKGIKLSGGQKQRLCIARAFLQNPDVIIFDESTSALDSENERAIVEAVQRLSEGKTVITIAHRLSAILLCDRVAVMDAGGILAADTHEKLRGRNQIYDLLFEKQYQFVTDKNNAFS